MCHETSSYAAAPTALAVYSFELLASICREADKCLEGQSLPIHPCSIIDQFFYHLLLPFIASRKHPLSIIFTISRTVRLVYPFNARGFVCVSKCFTKMRTTSPECLCIAAGRSTWERPAFIMMHCSSSCLSSFISLSPAARSWCPSSSSYQNHRDEWLSYRPPQSAADRRG